MIFRRFLQRFQQQPRGSIATELAIVVIGVFIGLQVSNWDQTRAERSHEAVYLAGLAKEVRSDIVDIDEIIRISTLRMSSMGYLIEQATSVPLPSGFDLARGRIEIEPSPSYAANDPNTIGVAMLILTTLVGNRLTYDEMTNTGDIGIIRDNALVREMLAYYPQVDKVQSFEAALEIDRIKLVDAQQQAGLLPVDAMSSTQITTAFANEPALLAAAKNYWLYTNHHLKLMKDFRATAERFVADIEKGTAA